MAKKIVQHINYGNAKTVKSKRPVAGAPSWFKNGLVFNIDNPAWPIIMALAGWLQKQSNREQNRRKLLNNLD